MTCSRGEAWFVVNLTPFTQPVAGQINCCVFQSLILTTNLQRAQLASGTRVRGFKPGRIRRIFRAKKSLACLPSEGT
jgi:hypothetical protein